MKLLNLMPLTNLVILNETKTARLSAFGITAQIACKIGLTTILKWQSMVFVQKKSGKKSNYISVVSMPFSKHDMDKNTLAPA